MEGYQAAVAAIADRRGNQEEFLRLALERRLAEDRQQELAQQLGTDALPNTVEVRYSQPQ